MINAIIIDDELSARQNLNSLIALHCPNVHVIDQVSNVPDSVKSINKYKPELVFSDIEMPHFSGLELPDFFDKVDFELVFTTAFSEYAVKAFELSAVGYLLKPITADQLVKAVERAIKMRGQSLISERLQMLKGNIQNKVIKKIALSQSDGITFVNIDDIIYLKADGYCTHFILNGGRSLLITKNIKEFENQLSDLSIFYRVHRSYVINTNYITNYQKSDGGIVTLSNGHQVDVSRERKAEFEQFLLK